MNPITLLVFVATGVYACHPECTDPCSNTVCKASCRVIIENPTPNCTVICNNGTQNGYITYCQPPTCIYEIPPDQCETDSCPVIETLCQQLRCSCLPSGITCEIQCQAPSPSSWLCKPPVFCPNICNLQCSAPACAYDGPPINSGTILVSLFTTVFYQFVNVGVFY
jgi:hypothetical protein